MSLQFTCVACRLSFLNSEIQRQHYKTDWHRYNLKRKVEDLPPVKLDVFNLKKAELELELKKEAEYAENGTSKRGYGYCSACRKSFSAEKTYVNHLNSKKHKDAVVKTNNQTETLDRATTTSLESDDDDDDVEIVDSDEWDEYDGDKIPITDCLFCSHHSANVAKNIAHMSLQHSFFLPDVEYLIDVDGLLEYLGAKVGQGRICLWCNGKQFQDTLSVQKHMTDKGHCKMKHEGDALIEYDEFYDYSSSYPDAEEDDKDNEVEVNEIDDSGYELVLPSGVKVGHRSLFRYYKQRMNPERSLVLRRPSSNHGVLDQYKSMGWCSGLTASEARKKAKDIKFMRKIQQKHYMQLGWKANKLQKHRRDPTIVFG